MKPETEYSEIIEILGGPENCFAATDAPKYEATGPTPPITTVNNVTDFPQVKLKRLPSRKLSDAFKNAQPPIYLAEGFLQLGRLVCCTAPKGHHKTDLAILLAFAVAGGNAISDKHPVRRKGRVLFMAGENPEDVIDRMRALADKLGYDRRIIDRIEFFDGAFDFTKSAPWMLKAYHNWQFDLVLIDTAQAYGPRDDSNSNTQMLKFAHSLRKLKALGDPAVFVLAHPTKSATKQNDKEFEPYGGSAFGNEVDGLCSMHRNKDGTIRLSSNAKWRGSPWEDMHFTAGVINDCALLRYDQIADSGETYTTQGTAPFLTPIVGAVDRDKELGGIEYSKLRANQKTIINAIMQLTISTKKSPDAGTVVALAMTHWETGTEKYKKQAATRALNSLITKGAVEQHGVALSIASKYSPPTRR